MAKEKVINNKMLKDKKENISVQNCKHKLGVDIIALGR
jgi:hypothetical protein